MKSPRASISALLHGLIRSPDPIDYLSRHPSLQSIPYWISAILAGFAAVGYATLFKLANGFTIQLFQRQPLVLLALAPLCFTAGWWLVHRFGPEAAGSGIPQAMAANELDHGTDGPAITSLIGIRTSIVKILSSVLCVIGGGVIGREGPTIQISASLFHFVGSRFQRIWPKLNHHSWIVAGGAAGIASAFNTPLGGIVFAIEELATEHFSHFRSILIPAVIISGLVAQWLLGTYLYLGYPQVGPVSFSLLPLAITTGVVTGLAGGLFGRLLFYFSGLRRKVKSPLKLGLIAALCGLVIAGSALFLGTRAIGPGTELMEGLLFRGEPGSAAVSLARFTGSMVSYLSGCAGGIFAPSLAAGAAIGAQIAAITTPENANLVILLGMVGFLTGVTRAPFTAFVLVLEMTDHHSLIFLLMIAAVTAQGVARLVSRHSFYEQMKEVYLQSFGA